MIYAANRADKLERTIAIMKQMIRRGSTDSKIRTFALDVLQGVPEHNQEADVKALAEAVKANVRFTRDPWNVETISDARDTLFKLKAGDCDDLTVLICALYQTVGYPTRLQVVGESNDDLSHVYPEVRVNGMFRPIDLARPDRDYQGLQSWPVERTEYADGMGSWLSDGIKSFSKAWDKNVADPLQNSWEKNIGKPIKTGFSAGGSTIGKLFGGVGDELTKMGNAIVKFPEDLIETDKRILEDISTDPVIMTGISLIPGAQPIAAGLAIGNQAINQGEVDMSLLADLQTGLPNWINTGLDVYGAYTNQVNQENAAKLAEQQYKTMLAGYNAQGQVAQSQAQVATAPNQWVLPALIVGAVLLFMRK